FTVVLILGGFTSKTVVAGTQDYLQVDPVKMQWWTDARFGMFVHWGPVSLMGTEIGWSRAGERRGRTGTGTIAMEVYDNLYRSFYPVEFNAQEWVELAQAAGMKYLVFTTKHHDGFCMFDSKLTDYTIMNSPFKRDVVKELAEVCRAAGLRIGFYYSQPDWRHEDYRNSPERHKRYIEYLHGHVRELLSNYGKIDIMWFDGLSGQAEDWDADRLFKLVRSLQPEIIINNRCGLPGDFDTPEQRIGAFQTDRAWETCMTIGTQWAWKVNEEVKSLKQCLRTLIQVVGGDGNLLFNVGPMPTGTIEPRQAETLREMGRWLNKYGESIYKTRGGPFKPDWWGVSTYNGNRIYLHVLDWAGQDTFNLPAVNARVVNSRLLTGGEVAVKQDEEGINITVNPQDQQELDTIVVLELDKQAKDILPVERFSHSVATGKPAQASNVYRGRVETYGPDKAFDGLPGTRWATDVDVSACWLEVNLETPMEIDRVIIDEAYGERVRNFELQYRQGSQWTTFFKGTHIGVLKQFSFPSIKAQHIRLNILEAIAGPTITEVELRGPKKDNR
ncbi:alpha-L-fucosidase, partial [Planctomycetota bacterium]